MKDYPDRISGWSPDSKYIAFISDREVWEEKDPHGIGIGRVKPYLVDVDTFEVRKIMDI